ncbi:ead/Ea22-like family protein [Klebsiella pneumoniae]|nr:ead/Ea22-like family protein [Klebsiella pneumoniae]MEB2971876.1 ead/Ea22-like family protein [Klebsiella pneumoniae]
MTDITELAQSLKAAAEKATPGPWGVARDGKTLVSNQSHPIATVSDAMHRMLADGSTGKDAEFIALANPANILALVEALEKAQETIAFQQGEIKALLSSLESRTVTVKLAEDKPAESESEVDDAEAWFDEGWNARGEADRDALAAAGIKVEAE